MDLLLPGNRRARCFCEMGLDRYSDSLRGNRDRGGRALAGSFGSQRIEIEEFDPYRAVRFGLATIQHEAIRFTFEDANSDSPHVVYRCSQRESNMPVDVHCEHR